MEVGDPEAFTFRPVGVLRCDFRERYEAPHQAVLASNEAVIELDPRCHPRRSLDGLASFDRLWLIFVFHQNLEHAPPLRVRPPRHMSGTVGVFATRAPHRPNPIGMSCVRLDRVEGRRIYVRDVDLLDGTPILDIKPYLPFCDAFPEASHGWRGEPSAPWSVEFTASSREALSEIAAESGQRLDHYAAVQLQFEPLDDGRKRITREGASRGWLTYQRWRLGYAVEAAGRRVLVDRVEVVAAGPPEPR